jgi:hypothetical protein
LSKLGKLVRRIVDGELREAGLASYEEIVHDLCAQNAGVETGKMFGMPVFKRNGKAAGGLWQESMVFKLTDAAARERALALEGAHAFDPMGGRPMKEWVVVPAAQSAHWRELAEAAIS